MPEVLDFSLGTSTGELSVPSAGTLKAGIWYTNAQTGTTEVDGAQVDLKWSVGFTVGTGTTGLNQCATVQSEDGAAAANCDRYLDTGNAITVLTNTGTIDGEAYVSTINSTAVKFTRPVAFNGDYRVGGLVLHTTDITDAAMLRFTADTGGSTQSVSGTTFRPTAVFFLSIADTATDTRVDDAIHSFGIGLKTSTGGIKNGVVTRGSDNAADPSKVAVHAGNQRCIVLQNSSTGVDSVDGAASFLDSSTDGFDIFWDNTPASADDIIALAIRAPNVNLFEGTFGTTQDAQTAISGAGFAPTAGMVMSHLATAESSTGTFNTAGAIAVGSFTSPTARNTYGVRELNNQATMSMRAGRSEALACKHPTGGAREFDVFSMDSDGVTFTVDNPGIAVYFWTPLFGPSTGGAATVSANLSATLLAPQFAVPDGDLKASETGSTAFTWINELGGTTGLWQSIDETSPVDSDWIQSGVGAGFDLTGVTFTTTDIIKDGGPNGWLGGTEAGGDEACPTWGSTAMYVALSDGSGLHSTQSQPKTNGTVWSDVIEGYPPTSPFGGVDIDSKTNVFGGGLLAIGGASTDGGTRIYWHESEQGTPNSKFGYTDDEFGTRNYYSTGWDYTSTDGQFPFVHALEMDQNYAGGSSYQYWCSRLQSTGQIGTGVLLFRAPTTDLSRSAHEYFTGLTTGGLPTWSSTLAAASPVLSSTNGVGWGTVPTYWPAAQRYLLTFQSGTSGTWDIWQSTAVWGPYTLVQRFTNWIDTAQKFIFRPVYKWSNTTTGDGLTCWWTFSGTGTYDAMCAVPGTFTTT